MSIKGWKGLGGSCVVAFPLLELGMCYGAPGTAAFWCSRLTCDKNVKGYHCTSVPESCVVPHLTASCYFCPRPAPAPIGPPCTPCVKSICSITLALELVAAHYRLGVKEQA